MSERYDPRNVLDNQQVAHIRDIARTHGPGQMRIYMSDVMALCDTAQVVRSDNARLRELLAGLVGEDEVRDVVGHQCFFCRGWDEHFPDCKWLAAKQYLQEHPAP